MKLGRGAACGPEKGPMARRLGGEQREWLPLSAAGLLVNLLYALYNGVVGMATRAVWFVAMGAYYTILSVLRYSVVLCGWKSGETPSADREYFVMRLSGALLAALSMVLGGFVYAELKRGIAVRHDTILMITIATYTFDKLAMACVRAVKQRKNPAPLLALVRTIGYADAAASVLTMQMTMIASFSRSGKTLPVLNAITGTAVCLFIFALGVITALRGVKRKDELRMAKSKLVKANERIAKKVVGTYKTIEKTVVGGYARVENAFVERYLTKEDETIEEAKQRLKRERE